MTACVELPLRFFFPSRATRWRQGLLCARPRHAEHQPASDRGETAPPPAPARARSVNTYARPSPHGNFARQPHSSLTCSAHWHARTLGRQRPGRAGCAAAVHHQAGARPPTARRSPPRSPASQPALHSTVNRRTAQYITQHTPARAQQRRRTRDSNTHTRTARARRTPPQRSTQSTLAHISSSQPATTHISHTRAHTPHCRRTHWASPRVTIRVGESACGPEGSRSGSLKASSRLSGSCGSSRRRPMRAPAVGSVCARV